MQLGVSCAVHGVHVGLYPPLYAVGSGTDVCSADRTFDYCVAEHSSLAEVRFTCVDVACFEESA